MSSEQESEKAQQRTPQAGNSPSLSAGSGLSAREQLQPLQPHTEVMLANPFSHHHFISCTLGPKLDGSAWGPGLALYLGAPGHFLTIPQCKNEGAAMGGCSHCSPESTSPFPWAFCSGGAFAGASTSSAGVPYPVLTVSLEEPKATANALQFPRYFSLNMLHP